MQGEDKLHVPTNRVARPRNYLRRLKHRSTAFGLLAGHRQESCSVCRGTTEEGWGSRAGRECGSSPVRWQSWTRCWQGALRLSRAAVLSVGRHPWTSEDGALTPPGPVRLEEFLQLGGDTGVWSIAASPMVIEAVMVLLSSDVLCLNAVTTVGKGAVSTASREGVPSRIGTAHPPSNLLLCGARGLPRHRRCSARALGRGDVFVGWGGERQYDADDGGEDAEVAHDGVGAEDD